MNDETRTGSEEKKKPIRRRYGVDRLPGHVQAQIFRGYVRGDAYWKIRAMVKELGHEISENALSRYWRNVWGEEVNRIRTARQYKEALKEALLEAPESENAKLAEELLYSVVMTMLDRMQKERPLDLLREAREQGKAAPKSTGVRRRAQTGAEEGRVVRERWRALYGIEESDEQAEKEERTD